MMKQNEEISAVYQKYGVSPTGSCVQLLVQMPVLLALYQVIYHIPGYISGVRNVFTGLTAKIMSVDGFGTIISNFLTDNKITMTGITANTEFQKKQPLIFCTNCLRHRWKSLQTSAISAALQICLIK